MRGVSIKGAFWYNFDMNIKRRLFISNILMVVIPLVLSLAVFWCGMYAAGRATGLRERYKDRPKEYVAALVEMRALAARWSGDAADDARIRDDAEKFGAAHEKQRFRLLVYRKGRAVTRQTIGEVNPTLREALSRGTPVSFVSRMAVDVERAGDLSVALMDADFHARDEVGIKDVVRIGLAISVLCSLLIVLLTNRFLTQFVFRHIVQALDTLAAGVYRISDGDLNARIEYPEDDEFAQICRDFNGMAARLLDSANERERDEANRRELIAGVSHDLRTPLASIKAYVEGIQQGVAASPEARKRYIDTIGNKAAELERIVDKLFLFSKLEVGGFPYHMETAGLAGALSEIVGELAEEYAAKGLDISFEAGGEELSASIDTTQFRNVVVNILENSVKYKMRTRASMKIELARKGEWASISFVDDGPGVSKEVLPKLFDLFFRGDPSRGNADGGSGLGLAIAAKVVERFGGTIAAENMPGGGLAVIISLPLCAASTPEGPCFR